MKPQKSYFGKVSDDVRAKILSFLPPEDRLNALKAFPGFKCAFSLENLKDERYTWEGRYLPFKGKHAIFSVKDGYIECTATSGLLESCLLQQGPSDYHVNPDSTMDPTPFLDDDLFAALPIGFSHQDLRKYPEGDPRASTDPRLFPLHVTIWIFDECGNQVDYITHSALSLQKLLEMDSGETMARYTVRKLLEGIAKGAEEILHRSLRKRAHYGKKFEFQVFLEKADGTLRVEVHPNLDEIFPFPAAGEPSTGPSELLQTDSDPLYRREHNIDISRAPRSPTPEDFPPGYYDKHNFYDMGWRDENLPYYDI
ncbi:hypothetical protein TWF481_004531 [Arthrobotrys musiformis]|uniref:Uncharacterized protein n=1 Tax=Arthrobotrys musiformis TaxID=47236 RepID=A0AAV9WJT2_9PEZI